MASLSPASPHLSVPGNVMSLVKEGPRCLHNFSVEFSPEIPITAAWKSSLDRCGAGVQRAREGGLTWAAPVVQDRTRASPQWLGPGCQADQLGESLVAAQGLGCPGRTVSSKVLSTLCAVARCTCVISIPPGRTLWATRLEQST